MLVSGHVEVTSLGLGTTATGYRYWTPQAFGPDSEVWAQTIGEETEGEGWRLMVRIQDPGGASTWDGYQLINWEGGTEHDWYLRRYTNGSATDLAVVQHAAMIYTLFRAVGDRLEGWGSNDGVNWTLVVSATDSTYSSAGFVGIGLSRYSGGNPVFGSVGGGTAGGGTGGSGPPPATQSIGTCDGSGTHANSGTGCLNEPVNTLTGAYTTHVADLRLPGIGVPFSWTRSYTSSDPTAGRLGPGWTDDYDTSLAVQPNGDVALHGDEGQEVHYTKQGDGSFVGAAGALSTLSSVAGGYKLVRRDQVTYLFDAQGRLTSEKDRNGEGLTFAYDGSGQLQTITDSVGRQISVQTSGGLVTQVTLPDGRNVQYGYTSGLLTSVTDARGGTTQYAYDAGGRLQTIADQDGHRVVRNVYDQTSGRVTDQYDALNDHSTFAWDPQTQTATLTDARGNQWKDVYSGNLLVQRIDPLGNTTQFDYDASLNVKKVTDARGNATAMTYDGAGNMLTRTAPAPLGYQETWTYDALDDPLTYTDGRGNKTDFGYDAAGNLTSITGPDPDGAGPLGRPQTLLGRDPAGSGLLTSLTDPRGKRTTYGYDAQGDLSSITTPLNELTTLCYDGSGRLVGVVDPRGTQSCQTPNGYRWSYAFDDGNELETQTDPLGHATTLVYDPAGNLLSRQDANGHVTGYGYDNANRLTSVTAPDPDGPGPLAAPVTQYAYDAVGNLSSRTDANGHLTGYAYDAANRLTSLTAPGNRVWSYAYDASGNVTQMVDANGNATPATGDGQTTYGYDALDRLNAIDYSDTTPDVTFAYDANGNRTQMTDGQGTETSAYDALDRLTSLTRGTDVFSYGYDLANLVSATYPGQPAIAYAYDDDERLQSVSQSGLQTSYGYDPAGNLKTTTLPAANGYLETRSYDQAGRLTDVLDKKGASTLADFALSLDPVGNPTRLVRTGSLAQTQTYGYDNMDRLTSVCFQAGTCPGASDPFIRFTYDGVGNRLSEARPSGTTSSSYDAADELTQAGSTAYTYDQNGNELSAGSRTFTYDLQNRLKSTTLGSTTTSYAYDGLGKRLQASTGSKASQKTSFLWDTNQGLPQIALERGGSGSLLRRYLYGLGRISMSTGSSPSYYLEDGLGSVTNLTSASGATQWTWSYEPFGGTRTETKASGKQPTNFMRFAGEYQDPTGLYHLRARQYDPASGRFLSRDPLAPALSDPSLSAYAYAGNVPTLYVDPSGLISIGGSYECVRHPVRCAQNSGPVASARAKLNQSVAAGFGVSPPSPPVVATPPPPYAASTVFGSPTASSSWGHCTARGKWRLGTAGLLLGAGAIFFTTGVALEAAAGVDALSEIFGGGALASAIATPSTISAGGFTLFLSGAALCDPSRG